MSDSIKLITKPVILPYQQAVYERLYSYARACLYVDRKSISTLKLRASFLLLGPTGAGKTFLAKAISQEMQVPFLSVSVSDWIILGGSSRGSSVTWSNIVQFIQQNRNKRGAIIFIDELDKCYHDSNWNSFLRSEIFSLCDARIPLGLNDMDEDNPTELSVDEAESFLSHKTMIIGGAAFQGIWEEQSAPKMGFNPDTDQRESPELSDLVKYLPRELINRFSSEIFALPVLTKSNYRVMIETMADKIPDIWRERFMELGIARLDQAVNHQKGVRYAEEILMAAIVAERGCMANFVPGSEKEKDSDNAPENPDESMMIL